MTNQDGSVRITVYLRDKARQAVKKIQGQFKGLRKDAVDALKKVNEHLGRMATNAIKLGTAMATGAAVGVAALTTNAILNAEALDKMSQRTGFAVEELSTLRFAAEQGGASLEDLELGLKTISRTAVEASQGTGEALGAFKALGIDLKDSNGNLRDTRDILGDVADEFSKYRDSATKTAAAQRIFGESGTKLIPMLNGGAEGLREMQEQARQLGAEVRTNTARQAAQLADNINALETNARGIGMAIGRFLLPTLVSVSGRLVQAAQAGRLMNQVWAETVTAATRFQQYLTGNEDGMGQLHKDLDLAKLRLEALRAAYKMTMQEEPGFLRSGKAIVEDRKRLLGEMREYETKIGEMQKRLDQGVANAARRRERALKLQAEAEAARRKAEETSLAGKGILAPFSTSPGAGGGKPAGPSDAQKGEESDTLKFYERLREAKTQELQVAAQIQQEMDIQRMTEREQLAAHYKQKLDMVRGYADAEAAVIASKNQALAKFDRERSREMYQEEARRYEGKRAALDAIHGLAVQAGVRSHGAQKAIAIAQGLLSFQVAKMKALAEGGPLAGPALIAAIVGLASPILGAIRGSTPFGGGAGAGLGAGGGLTDFAGQGGGGGIPAQAPVARPAEPPRAAGGVAVFNIQGNLISRDYVRNEFVQEMREATRLGYDFGSFETRDGRLR